MTEIKLKVTDQHLRAVVYPLIASGGINENRITVEFEGTEWAGYVCGVAFNTDDDPDTIYTQNLDGSNQCIVPWEVTEKAGTLFVAVYGTAASDVKRTTEVTAIEIVNGAGNGNAIPAPPTPTVYDQLVALINTKQNLLVSGTNIKTINGNDLLGSGNITISPAGIYKCTTANTFSEIYAAFYTDGRLPVFDDGTGRKYYPTDLAQSSPNVIQFASTVEDSTGIKVAMAYVDSTDVWNVYDYGYIQEKLVSGTSIKTINNTSLLGSGDISISGSSDLYVCTYGTTTHAEVEQALSDGKLPICIYNYGGADGLYTLQTASGTFVFETRTGTNATLTLMLRADDTWTRYSTTYQDISYRVTSISSASTNTQYPSAKCVYDAIQNVIGSGVTSYLLDMSTYTYSSGRYTVTGINLVGASKITLECSALENPTNFRSENAYIDNVTASSFDIVSGNSISSNHLILTVYS